MSFLDNEILSVCNTAKRENVLKFLDDEEKNLPTLQSDLGSINIILMRVSNCSRVEFTWLFEKYSSKYPES